VDASALDAIFVPRSVVVVGASADPRKRGHQVLAALDEAGYAGRVYAVNPRGGEILGRRVHDSLESLPEAPDLALVCTPAATTPEIVAACGRRGVRGAVVLAVGFRESGPQGRELERRMMEAARGTAIRIVGPNTSGILNLPLGLNLIGARDVRAGTISLLVQSGNMALALMNEVTARTEEGISLCVGVGNEADLGFEDYLAFLGSHSGTRAIVVYAEGFRDARAFLETAAQVTRTKPVVFIKGARSEASAASARSHTGAVAGSYALLRAGLRQAGVVEVRRSDELCHVAQTLTRQPPMTPTTGVAVLSDGGGQGTLAVDALTGHGVPLATLSRETRAAVEALLGPAAAVSNPVDLAGAADARPEAFADALDVLAADPEVGSVLLVGLFGGYGIRFAGTLTEGEVRAAERMAERMRAADKPLVVHSIYALSRSEPLHVLGSRGVPVVESLEVACRCVAAAAERGRALAAEARWPRPPGRKSRGVAPLGCGRVSAPDAAVRSPRKGMPAGSGRDGTAILARVREEERLVLTEPDARALLVEGGLRFSRSILCRVPQEVVAAVRELGATVALKVVSTAIPHKTEAGGVALGLATPSDAARAFVKLRERCLRDLEASGSDAGIEGVLVTPMLPPPLVELLVGARRDDPMGPALTLGAGGVWVEVLEDVVHRLLPVAEEDIVEALGELRIAPLLRGMRGRPAADLAGIARAAREGC